MQKFVAVIITILGLLVIGLIAAAVIAANQPSGYEQAAIINAQGQARLDTALATATVTGVVGVAALGLIGLVGLLVLAGLLIHTSAAVTTAAITGVVALMQPGRPRVIIERQVLYLPRPGQKRRELWQQLSDVGEPVEVMLPAAAGQEAER
ncbi:MAG: hypothetical protein Kow0031_02690 [Anaerolineae bacterium]